MPATLNQLTAYLSAYLRPDSFQDYCPNGLQVEGRAEVRRLVSGVTACQALIEQAVAWQADAILVHHGYFWRGEAPQVVGMKRRRLSTLLASDVSLLAYHLPLDAHPELGNNARWGLLMGIALEAQRPLQPDLPGAVGNVGELPTAMSARAMLRCITHITGRDALHIGNPDAQVRRIAWCTGAAQDYIDAAVAAGADMFVTGEASEQTVHVAREECIQFVAAGHHATERYGVQALGEHLSRQFEIEHLFIDVDNPV